MSAEAAQLRRLQGEAAMRRLVAMIIERGDMTPSQAEVTYRALTKVATDYGLETHLESRCLCGQMNRVDKARALVQAGIPVCAKCKLPLPLKRPKGGG